MTFLWGMWGEGPKLWTWEMRPILEDSTDPQKNTRSTSPAQLAQQLAAVKYLSPLGVPTSKMVVWLRVWFEHPKKEHPFYHQKFLWAWLYLRLPTSHDYGKPVHRILLPGCISFEQFSRTLSQSPMESQGAHGHGLANPMWKIIREGWHDCPPPPLLYCSSNPPQRALYLTWLMCALYPFSQALKTRILQADMPPGTIKLSCLEHKLAHPLPAKHGY